MVVIFIILFVFDLILLLTGYLVKYQSTRYPGISCGYHIDTIAMKNEKTWKEANRYYGSLVLRIALILLGVSSLLTAVLLIANYGLPPKNDTLFWSLFAYIMLSAFASAFGSIAATEHHLKKLFDTEGIKK